MGTKMEDGFKTLVSFAGMSSAGGSLYWETAVTPPGISAGGVIDTTTMRNTLYRTKMTRQLLDILTSSFTAAYDNIITTSLLAQVGVSQLITITFPDLTGMTFYGSLNEFVPGEFVEGEMPTAEFSIEPTNVNSAGTETAPALV
jgi:hypothetical protein